MWKYANYPEPIVLLDLLRNDSLASPLPRGLKVYAFNNPPGEFLFNDVAVNHFAVLRYAKEGLLHDREEPSDDELRDWHPVFDT